MRSEYKNAGPVYGKIKDGICRMITSHAVLEGEKLPPVRQIASRLAVNPGMVIQACKELEQDGYLEEVGEAEYMVSSERTIEELKKKRLLQEFDELVTSLTRLSVGTEELTKRMRNLAGGSIGFDRSK